MAFLVLFEVVLEFLEASRDPSVCWLAMELRWDRATRCLQRFAFRGLRNCGLVVGDAFQALGHLKRGPEKLSCLLRDGRRTAEGCRNPAGLGRCHAIELLFSCYFMGSKGLRSGQDVVPSSSSTTRNLHTRQIWSGRPARHRTSSLSPFSRPAQAFCRRRQGEAGEEQKMPIKI